jgi:hypothetical protein
MIVRDEEQNLADCLESVRAFADQIVVVDTGSTDATVEVALAHGAEVHHFDGCDDFAAARNESLRHARSRWILWLDADTRTPTPAVRDRACDAPGIIVQGGICTRPRSPHPMMRPVSCSSTSTACLRVGFSAPDGHAPVPGLLLEPHSGS